MAATSHFAISRIGSRLGTSIRPICSATLPCSKLLKTGESCSADVSSVASSTADSRFSRSCGSLISTCDAISSLAGLDSSFRKHVVQITINTGTYMLRLSPQRALSLSSQYQSMAATMATQIRNATSPAQTPRATINHMRRRANCCSLLATMGSSPMLIVISLLQDNSTSSAALRDLVQFTELVSLRSPSGSLVTPYERRHFVGCDK